ncbi:MAG: DsbA family protein [Thermoplasmatota archaeon]
MVVVYFTFSSTYSYLAWHRITRGHPERYKEGVEWQPVNFLRLKELSGLPPKPPSEQELAYNRQDAARWAAAYQIPYVGAPVRRFGPTQDAVLLYLVARAQGAAVAAAWMAKAFEGYRVRGQDLSDRELLLRWAKEVGIRDPEAQIGAPKWSQELEKNTDAAFRAGAPGVPYAVLGGEGFWGNDRLEWVEARLAGRTAPAHV